MFIKRLIPLFICISISFGCATSQYSSSKKYENLYENTADSGFTLIKTWIDYSVEEKDGILIYKHYEPEFRQLYHKIYLKKKNLVPEGDEFEWYSNGELYFKGKNHDGKRHGRWEFFDIKGNLEEYGDYVDGKRNGIWTNVDSTGRKTAIFNYYKNELNGQFFLFDDEGETYKEGIYKEGELVSYQKFSEYKNHPNEVYDKEFKVVSCENAGRKARRACNNNDLLAAIYQIASYPDFEKDREVTGSAIITIEISEDGRLSDLKILRSISQNFEKTILKLNETDFIFEPAILDGMPVASKKNFVLEYYPPGYNYRFNPDPFWMQNMAPPVPTFTPPSF